MSNNTLPTFKTAFGKPDSTPVESETARGFQTINFTDLCGQEIEMQESSIIWDEAKAQGPETLDNPGSSAVWIFVTSDLTGKRKGMRIGLELCRDRVDYLIEVLQHWRKTGRLHTK